MTRRVRRQVPGTEMVYSSTDLHVGELFAHAQSCLWLLGHSDLATTLLAGKDPHSDGAATVMGVTYDEFMRLLKKVKDPFAKANRQGFKPFSFGKPAGMGVVKIVLNARRQGPDTPCANGPLWIVDGNRKVRGYKGTRFCVLVDRAERCGYHADGRENKVTTWGKRGREQKIVPTCAHCLEVALRLDAAWKRAYREWKPYNDLIQTFVEDGMVIRQEALDRWPWLHQWFAPDTQLDAGQIMQHYSGRIRGGLEFSECANTFFQALVGELTKAAFWRASMECYDRTIRVPEFAHPNSRRSRYAGGPSPLLGSRLIGFFHDEIFGEHPRSVGHDCAWRLKEIMEEEEMYYLPDLAPKCSAEPTLMQGGWFKNAEITWRDGLDGDHSKPANENDIIVPWVPPIVKRISAA